MSSTPLFKSTLIFSLVLSFFVLISPAAYADNPIKVYEAEGEYEDVKFDLKDAIVAKGLKVVYEGHLATMLERTAKDVGAPNPYKHAEYFLFCSARHSNASVNADNNNIGFCPYIIFAYETKAKPGFTTIGYRRPLGGNNEASKKALAAIDKLIDGVARAAAGIE